MESPGVFAERIVDLLTANKERIPFRVQFGPIEPAGQSFRCKVVFQGWGDSPPAIWGYDSVQAFVLALELVRGVLTSFVEEGGGRVQWPGTLEDYDLSAWSFGALRDNRDTGS